MPLKIVTNHFVTMADARRHYRPHYARVSDQAFNWRMRHKLEDGELVIGEPELEEGQRAITEGGRYYIVEGV
jgi:hypothetical protein